MLLPSYTAAQQKNILFYQLNTLHGLSDNVINALCTDKNGNLWVGAAEGLNRFNGNTVTRYLNPDYPQLANNNILSLICDDENRIWIHCDNGAAAMADADRRFHKLALLHNNKAITVKRILKTSVDVILLTSNGFYTPVKNYLPAKNDSLTLNNFLPLTIAGTDTLLAKNFSQVEPFDAHSYIFSRSNFFYKINFQQKKIEQVIPAAGLWFLLQWQPGKALVYDRSDQQVKLFNLQTAKLESSFSNLKDQFGKPLAPRILSAKRLDDKTILLTSVRDGMYILNPATNTLTRYTHRAGDATTIANDRPAVTCLSEKGWVFIGSKLNGISYFKKNAVAGMQSFFADEKGNRYDGYINSIATRDYKNYYIGTGNNLIKWNRNTNTAAFINYADIDGKPVVNEEGTSLLCFDKFDRLWFITSTKGIVVMDKNERMVKRFATDTAAGIKAAWAEQIIQGPDGWIWIASSNGVRRINPVNFEVDDMRRTPFAKLEGMHCMKFLFTPGGDIWVATLDDGLWRCSPLQGGVQKINSANSEVKDYYALVNDAAGNVYAGTNKGVQIFFKNQTTKTIGKKDGLPNDRAGILMTDKKNRIWIGNVSGIACYNPADSSLKYFDEAHGLTSQRLRLWGYLHATDDEMLWGTDKGIQFFYPDELYNNAKNFGTVIHRIETNSITADLVQSKTFELKSGDNNISFYFGTSGYFGPLRTLYQYKLQGLDKDWQPAGEQGSIRYSSLPAGKYVFKLRAGTDNKTWTNAENKITILILPPFYKKWWFIILTSVLVLTVLFVWLKKRERNIKSKEKANTELHKLKAESYRHQLETEQVTSFFTSTIHQHNNIDELLWDVAKNLIGKLGFEECMIYLWNADKTTLVQRAGYGLKGDMQIVQNKEGYNIPAGKGIVGAAAESGNYVLVNDTSKDSRYFSADEKIMFSELSVPLLQKGKVVGVINTEHSKKKFFTDKHVKMLSTIASLCADKMEKIKAEEQTHEKEMELLKLNKDLATSQLTTLRAQMNPHFIFNALNSVQQYILKGSITEANRYLSKFSRLQRQVLNHSDQDFIPLEKELEILNLYLELEQLRFEGSFTCNITVCNDIDTDEIKIPPMIVQPFVENAIWHGLMPKQGERNLEIIFSLPEDDVLQCTVKDNGIGREAAARIKSNTQPQHTSKGLSLVYDRLAILRQQYGQVFNVQINDIKSSDGQPCGTEVILHIYTS